jgi:hypothetical protein
MGPLRANSATVSAMKLGCSSCLGLLVVLALGALFAGATVGAATRMLATPDISTSSWTSADGTRAQHKLFELARRTRATETVTLSEGEVNALLTRHLVEARGVRLASPSAQLLGGDRVLLDAQSTVRRLLDEMSLGALADILPARWQGRPVWIHVGARLRIEDGPRRHLRMDVDEFAVGRQRLPAAFLRVLLDPGSVGLLQWSLPDHIERVGIEPGRVVIHTAPPR